jgi:2-iminobutanoate/2-iminopropanoate deaminase
VISGQLGLLPGASPPELVSTNAPEQLRQALANAASVLSEAGAGLDQVVKATLFLVDMADFAACNEVWVDVFAPPRPTRSAIAVHQLPLGARAEVELWAHSPRS